MDYSRFIKKFSFPSNFVAPRQLKFEDLLAKPLTRKDLHADIEAVNSSLDLIMKTRGGGWPTEPVSEDFDMLDLSWHEREFRDRDSFAYVVYDDKNKYIGCFYLYPMGHRTTLTADLLNYDIDASWWVTSEAYERGYYEKLYKALQQWIQEFPVTKILYSNKEVPS